MIPCDVNCRRLLHLITDRFQMRTQVFIKPHPLQNCRLLLRCHALRRADNHFEAERVAAVLEPFLNLCAGEYGPQRGFDGVLCPQPPVNPYAVFDCPPLYLYRVRIVVPIDVKIIGQNIKGLFVQFVNAGINYILLDLLCRNL